MQNKEDVRGTSIGYAINLVMDYGSGRQVTISGTLPLGATLEEMNAELDKLRLATNRQSSLVVQRDIENTVAMSKKTVVALEEMILVYDKEMEGEMKKITDSNAGNKTLINRQVEGMRAQAANYKATKREEIAREQLNIDKGELVLTRIQKEIECLPPSK
jgi:hypothetical protein